MNESVGLFCLCVIVEGIVGDFGVVCDVEKCVEV